MDGDKEFPTICGTGTEDYFCGAYNFDVNGKYVEYTTPYAGMSKVDKTDEIYLANRRFNLFQEGYQGHHPGPGLAQRRQITAPDG